MKVGLLSLAMLALAFVLPHSGNAFTLFSFGLIPVMGSVLDVQQQFSSAQALTVTVASTNIIDLGAPPAGTAERRIGTGEPMGVVIFVTVAAGGTAPTLQVTLQSDDNVGFASAATVCQTEVIAAAGLTAGTKIVLPIPSGKATERYIRLNYTLTGTTPTVTVSAYLQPLSMLQQEQTYSKNFTVSV